MLSKFFRVAGVVPLFCALSLMEMPKAHADTTAQVQVLCGSLAQTAGSARSLNETTGGDLCVNITGLTIDAHGGLHTVLYDANGNPLDPTQPTQTYSADPYVYIAAGTVSTQIKSATGTLVRVSINTKGASANTITLYDNTACSGTIIAIIDGTSDRDHTYGLTFATGLCVKSTTGTGADITVVYR